MVNAGVNVKGLAGGLGLLWRGTWSGRFNDAACAEREPRARIKNISMFGELWMIDVILENYGKLEGRYVFMVNRWVCLYRNGWNHSSIRIYQGFIVLSRMRHPFIRIPFFDDYCRKASLAFEKEKKNRYKVCLASWTPHCTVMWAEYWTNQIVYIWDLLSWHVWQNPILNKYGGLYRFDVNPTPKKGCITGQPSGISIGHEPHHGCGWAKEGVLVGEDENEPHLFFF